MGFCEVCDQQQHSDHTVHGFPIHLACMPKYWRDDYKDREMFLGRVRMLAPSRLERWKKWR